MKATCMNCPNCERCHDLDGTTETREQRDEMKSGVPAHMESDRSPFSAPPSSTHHAMTAATRNTAAPKPKARGNRTSVLEIALRTQNVAKAIIAGVDDSDLVGFCREKWGVCDDTARSYISAANDELRRAFAHDAKREAQKALLRYESLFRACRQSGDLRAAATMQDRICKLLRLWDDGVIRHEAGDQLTELLQAIRRTGAAG